MKFFYLLLLQVLICFANYDAAHAQAPPIQFQKLFGGSHDDRAAKIIQTADKGYLLVGQTNSTDGYVQGAKDTMPGYSDILVIKTDSVGKFTWSKVLNTGSKVLPFAAAETKYSYIIGGIGNGNLYDFSAMPSIQYGFICWLNKTTGALTLIKGYNGGGSNGGGQLFDLQVMHDNSIIATGFEGGTKNNGNRTMWLAKIDGTTGNIKWEKYFGGSNGDYGLSVAVLPNGFVLSGCTSSTDGDAVGGTGRQDGFVVRTDTGGNFIWAKTFPCNTSVMPLGNAFRSVSGGKNGDIYCSGYANGSSPYAKGAHGMQDLWIVKLNASGDTLWTRSLGGSADDAGNSISATDDGGAIVFGYTASHDGDIRSQSGLGDGWLIRLNAAGRIVWDTTLGSSKDERFPSLTLTCDNSYAFLGEAPTTTKDVAGPGLGFYDMWLVKMKSDGLQNHSCVPIVWTGVSTSVQPGSFKISPNPAANSCELNWTMAVKGQVSISVANVQGQIVKQVVATVQNKYHLDLSGCSAGIYYVTCSGKDWRVVQRLLVR